MTAITVKVSRYLLILLPAALIGLAAASFGTTGIASGNSAPSGSYGTYSISGDYFFTWDFDGTSGQSSTTVDWPIRFLFRQNAEIDKVKDRLDGKGGDPSIWPELSKPTWFSAKNAYLDDGPEQTGSKWDTDSGIKAFNCVWVPHIRLYAQSGEDRNYNTTLGYYVIAAVHEDLELPPPLQGCANTYRSWESSEAWWAVRVQAVQPSPWNWQYATGLINFQNGTSGQTVDIGGGKHSLQSDGWGVTVWVP